jgi:hypothetical protein
MGNRPEVLIRKEEEEEIKKWYVHYCMDNFQ